MVREFEKQNYWAIILGGSSGLGLASAAKLAAHGMNILIVHRNTREEMKVINPLFEALKVPGIEVLTFNMDITNPACRAEVVKALLEKQAAGKIRCLLHSIAKGNLKAMVSDTAAVLENDDFVLTLQHMAISLYDWTKVTFEAKLFAEDARVLAFTSEGSAKAWKHYAAVSAAKASLEAITRSIALEFAPYGLRANCVQAGVTDTRSFRMIPGSDRLKEHSIENNPFKRLTTAEDVANVVYLLCKDEAGWINGAIIPVDGGAGIC
ncbi:SDR family oxidoreductase [Pedobacter sp. MC2016-14]|uniref:enoyl-ACP reductase FabI n=1 Tax=Pedobacter sp. MC2016-14 TaxID=2897327 RepID=UPI001E36BF0C|nr:SDR family oxidoreductase [Pedobacter sp. MC2016-14]MCD0490634.1 SDR family oxidoreductase [Pedobacter sp. MC2016-14]